MKHPLNWWHIWLREVACFFTGHDFKFSGVFEYAESQDHYLKMGNPYYRYPTSWRYKCRRCRSVYLERRDRWWIQL